MARHSEIQVATKKVDTQAVLAKIAENVEAIKTLVQECHDLSEEVGTHFTLDGIGLYTEDEARDNWAGSNC